MTPPLDPRPISVKPSPPIPICSATSERIVNPRSERSTPSPERQFRNPAGDLSGGRDLSLQHMSSYLWRYYLENDAANFRRLLVGLASRSGVSSTGIAVTSPPQASSSKQLSASAKQNLWNVTITRQALRELDSMGRNVLHLACSDPDGLPFVKALLSNPLTDPSIPDVESGWTAMHRALYHGNISAVRAILSYNLNNWGFVKIKDHAGDSPFEVFESSIHGFERLLAEGRVVEENQDSNGEEGHEGRKINEAYQEGGDEVFTFGSNKNLTLGFPDEDDRTYPERILLQRPHHLLLEQVKLKYSVSEGAAKDLLDATTLFNPLRIVDVQLSKLHTAILTSDSHSNLFICGFGHGGRLGFGDEQLTQPTLRPLSPPLLPKKRVERVAVGLDHTVAVLAGGEVWTWGGNKWGQLGYTVQQKTAQEEPIQSTPRQVLGGLKREIVIGCAASRIHTVVFTSTSLFTFGKNEGQLGILDSSDAKTLASQPAPRRVTVGFLTGTVISQVAAIDKATAVLVNHEVWILVGYGCSKLLFPTERMVGFSGVKNVIRYDNKPNFIRKITGGGDTLCALSRMGDAFTLGVEACLKERAEKGARVGWPAQRAWSLRKRHMAVRDADVGQDGSIIICTESGSVWRRVNRAKIKEKGVGSAESGRYKFDRVPGLTKVISVRSNMFGAFAAIRRDCDVMKTMLLVQPQTLWKDVAGLLSLRDAFVSGDGGGCIEGKWGYGPRPRPQGYGNTVKYFMKINLEQELKEFLVRLPLQRGADEWDMTISTATCRGIEIPVHKVLLSARSPVLRNALAAGSGQISNIAEILYGNSRLRLVFKDVGLLTVLSLVYYIYIDTVIDLWHQRNANPTQTRRFKVLRTELSVVASALGLKVLEHAVGRMQYPPRSLHNDFKTALKTPEFEQNTDLFIELARGESIRVHSAIMRARCPFFEALYGGGASGRWLLGRRGEGENLVKVDMKHVGKPVMEMVVNWLYTDWGPAGFDGVRVGVEGAKVDEYLDFVMDIMGVANELILERLSQLCQKVLGGYVNTRNAPQLLMAVAACSETGFKDMCMQYICSNMETMLENHLLDDLDQDLMSELDDVVKENQRRCLPNSRSNKQEQELLAKYPELPESRVREKEALIAFYTAQEDEPLPSSFKKASSYPPEPTSESPPQQIPDKACRKSSKGESLVMSVSPTSKPFNPGGDLMFDMDEEGAVLSTGARDNGKGIYSSPPSSLPKPDEGTWFDAKGKAIVSPAPSAQHPGKISIDPFATPKSSLRKQPLTLEWSSPTSWRSPIPGKIPMREIMAQTSSSSEKSNLSLGLSATSEKVSQKERKRQQQQQTAGPSAAPILSTPEKQMPKMWATPIAMSRVSLKEVLMEESSSPPVMGGKSQPSRSTSVRGDTQIAVSTSSSAPPRPPLPASTFHISPPSPLRPPIPRRSEATLHLSLADIMSQEEVHKEIMRDHATKRSLQEIQAEQEFLRWWDIESEKVRLETTTAERAASRGSGGRRGGGGGKRGGRGRGVGKRGRGESVASGQGGRSEAVAAGQGGRS